MKGASLVERRRLAWEVSLGAPIAGVVWFLLIRLVSGQWSLTFPLWIVSLSVVWSLLMLFPDPVGSFFFRLWKGLISIIDWIVTRVVCILLYYGIFTPLGILLRLCGVPLLQMKGSKDTSTYWKDLSPRNQEKDHFFKQY